MLALGHRTISKTDHLRGALPYFAITTRIKDMVDERGLCRVELYIAIYFSLVIDCAIQDDVITTMFDTGNFI